MVKNASIVANQEPALKNLHFLALEGPYLYKMEMVTKYSIPNNAHLDSSITYAVKLPFKPSPLLI